MRAANYWHCVQISLDEIAIKEFASIKRKMGKVSKTLAVLDVDADLCLYVYSYN